MTVKRVKALLASRGTIASQSLYWKISLIVWMTASGSLSNHDATWTEPTISWILLFRTPIFQTQGFLLRGNRLQASKASIADRSVMEVASFLASIAIYSISSLPSPLNLLLTGIFCIARHLMFMDRQHFSFFQQLFWLVLQWYCQSMYFEIRWWVYEEDFVVVLVLDLDVFLRVLL